MAGSSPAMTTGGVPTCRIAPPRLRRNREPDSGGPSPAKGDRGVVRRELPTTGSFFPDKPPASGEGRGRTGSIIDDGDRLDLDHSVGIGKTTDLDGRAGRRRRAEIA